MSGKQAKNSENETKKKQEKLKALKLPKTSKLGKIGVKNGVKAFSSRQRRKVSSLKSKVKTSFEVFGNFNALSFSCFFLVSFSEFDYSN
ncbi:hypothetical protein ES703_25911 [subsurface metagenome]